jgi:hypothetical protein
LIRELGLLGRYGGPVVAELVLGITPDVMVGKVRRLALKSLLGMMVTGEVE